MYTDNIKTKTVNGLFWSAVDGFASQGVQFLVGIILARLLTPNEFGLIGMLTIFIALSQSFIDSGFSNALIRKQNCTQIDYSTVFHFSFVISIIVYLILFLFSSSIALFFKEPQLEILLNVLGLGIIFNAIGSIHRTILIKDINFKLQTRVSIVASTLSGIIAVTMAYNDFGVWSLVALTLFRFGFTSLFLWVWGKWMPSFVFSRESFRQLFSFGSKLLISGLIFTASRNVYYLIIGKYFSAIDLGYFTRAEQFQALPSQQLTGIFGRVTYPILSTMQNDVYKLKNAYRQIIKSTMLVVFVLMLGLAAVAKPMILALIGSQWLPSVIYLQMLCFVGMLYPLHAINLNMLQVLGRSDMFLKLEVLKTIFAIPVIFIGVIYGIKAMIFGMFVHSVIAYYFNSYWSGKSLDYSSFDQIKDIVPSFLLAIVVATIVYTIGEKLELSYNLILVTQLIVGASLTIILSEVFKLESYCYIKDTVLTKFMEVKKTK